jgi:hypothetical protein
MKASQLILRIAGLIAVHGDKEVVYDEDKKFSARWILQDHKTTLVSAGETSEETVFTIS